MRYNAVHFTRSLQVQKNRFAMSVVRHKTQFEQLYIFVFYGK